MTTALIVSGGWPGHQPEAGAELIRTLLEAEGMQVRLSGHLETFDDPTALAGLSLIVVNWSMGRLTPAQSAALRGAVEAGCGLAGFHGGLTDAFREDTDYQFMVGGQFVAHPGGIRDYRVDPVAGHPLAQGLPSFEVHSEQYHLHVDPGNGLVATTTLDGRDAPWTAGTLMPVAWTRRYGRGRVFYSSLGHDPWEYADPTPRELLRRGLVWAARG